MKNDILSASDWLKKAEQDLAVAEHLLNTSEFYADICFHCQQIAEKSLKAFLVYYREVPRKIHPLKELLKDCLKYDNSLTDIIEKLETLDKLYIPTRYPFAIEFSKDKATEAIESARKVLEKIKSLIK
ncbi:MAG: HEPN domain-containing protein [Elusimicrobiota bacterium]